MTSREQTGFLPIAEGGSGEGGWADWAHRLIFGAIGWPWLLRSLWGGTRASRLRLLARLGLEEDALPHLGSWKADAAFLHRIVDMIEAQRPAIVVELGAGASTLVAARALQLHGGGALVSYDQHAPFIQATAEWLAGHGLDADLRHAPLTERVGDWPGRWYRLDAIPPRIDLLIIDGPPWTEHPYVRGAAECLFDRLADGAVVLLDDAARPGERVVARRWRRRWPGLSFELVHGGAKGTLVIRKRPAHQPAATGPASRSGRQDGSLATALALFGL